MRVLRTWLLAGLLALGVSAAGLADQTDGRLDLLFGQLAITADPVEARSIEEAIWQIWIDADDDKVDALMTQGIVAMNSGQLAVALAFFEEVTRQAPKFAEGWNKRATVHFLMQDFNASVRDIARTLELEPRHFGALSGLGLINLALDRPEAALKAFEQVLKIHPHSAGTQSHVKRLRDLLKGDET